MYLLRYLQLELANDHRFLNYHTIYKFVQAGFLIFVLVFLCHVTLNFKESLRLVHPQKFSDFSEIWCVDRGR